MIKPLTSFRFFAALAVFCSHLSILKNFKETEWLFTRIFYEGYLGVTFFFILSGFILTYNYYEKFQTLDKTKFNKFIKARLSRIYPVYVLTFFISIPLVLSSYSTQPIKATFLAFFNLGMVQSFIPINNVYFSFNAPSWSISNEMFFYLLFPILLYFLLKIGADKNIKILTFSAISVYFIALIVVWVMRDSSLSHWLFYISPPFRLIDFFIGVVLGIAFFKYKDTTLTTKTFSLLEVLSILLLLIAFYFFPQIHQTIRFWGYYLPFMVFIIWIFAFQKGIISKFISNKNFIYLGEISFSFYMIHLLVIMYFEKIPFISGNPYRFIILTLAISLTLSHIIYKYYEIPLKNKFKYKPTIISSKAEAI